MAAERSTFLLDETQIPTQWYNLIPDLPSPPPPPPTQARVSLSGRMILLRCSRWP